MLDGFQAGLAWITILRKREAFRERFQGFEPDVVARWGEPEIAAALAKSGVHVYIVDQQDLAALGAGAPVGS